MQLQLTNANFSTEQEMSPIIHYSIKCSLIKIIKTARKSSELRKEVTTHYLIHIPNIYNGVRVLIASPS